MAKVAAARKFPNPTRNKMRTHKNDVRPHFVFAPEKNGAQERCAPFFLGSPYGLEIFGRAPLCLLPSFCPKYIENMWDVK